MTAVSVIIPAHDEAADIGRSLQGLLEQLSSLDGPVEVLVVANGCTDDTAARARGLQDAYAARDVVLTVIERSESSKTAALNEAEGEASGDVIIYSDADISMAPGTIAALVGALDDPGVDLVSAHQRPVLPQNRLVRGWVRCYHASPYQRGDDVVHGLFAVTRAGRRRFGPFPETMADDRFLSLNFPRGRRRRVREAVVDIRYTESVGDLVAQQARWVANNADIDRRFPELLDANAPGHNQRRWPYFERPWPGPVDLFGFAFVTVAARWRVFRQRDRILGRWDRARPAPTE